MPLLLPRHPGPPPLQGGPPAAASPAAPVRPVPLPGRRQRTPIPIVSPRRRLTTALQAPCAFGSGGLAGGSAKGRGAGRGLSGLRGYCLPRLRCCLNLPAVVALGRHRLRSRLIAKPGSGALPRRRGLGELRLGGSLLILRHRARVVGGRLARGRQRKSRNGSRRLGERSAPSSRRSRTTDTLSTSTAASAKGARHLRKIDPGRRGPARTSRRAAARIAASRCAGGSTRAPAIYARSSAGSRGASGTAAVSCSLTAICSFPAATWRGRSAAGFWPFRATPPWLRRSPPRSCRLPAA